MSTFRRSLRALSHPLSLAAIGLLLLNDHVLKAAYPSWLTGKLSDFAGLFFFPFVLIALAALPLAILRAGRRTQAWLPLVAFGLTAGWFAAIKLWPAANAATAQVAGWFAGGTVFIAPDATDVMALVSLVPAGLLWRRLARTAPASSTAQATATDKAFGPDWTGLAALTLAAVATIASSPCPTPPIVRQVTVIEDKVYAAVNYHYMSVEGDRTYRIPTGTYELIADQLYKTITYPLITCDPTNEQICYRIGTPDQVEELNDHGTTWQIAWRVPEARRAYIERYALSSSCWGPASLDAGPYDLAFVERADGMEVVVAMGGQGLLVRTGDGEWHRRQLDGASPIPWEAGAAGLIWIETLISLGVGWLAVLALAARAARPLLKQARWVAAAVLTFVGIGMILWVVFFPPSMIELATVALISFLLGWPVLLSGFMLGLARIAGAFGAGRAWHSLAVVSLVTAVTYGSFYAWTAGYIARYEVAAGVAVLTSLAILWLTARSTSRWQKKTSTPN